MTIGRRAVLRGAAALAAMGAGAVPVDGTPRPADPDLGALAADLDGLLVRPGDPAYPEARRLYQPRYDAVAPAAVAYPAHDRDVATCLGFARRTGVPVVPRGGGHSYAGWSTGTGLVVDVSALDRLVPAAGGVTVGAGVRLGDLHAGVAAAGAALPAGLCPSVGVAGLALGGGLGVASRAYGTTSDQLTGARVVTADGRVREVDGRQDADLFWALRGAGAAGFGIVTEFRFRTRPAVDCAFAELHWPWRDAGALLRGWQRWQAALPDPYWSQVECTVTGGPLPAPVVRVVGLDGVRELEERLTALVGLVGAEPRDRWVVVRGHAETMRAMSGCAELSAAQCRLPGSLPGRGPQGRLGREDYAARSDFWPAGGLPNPAVDAVLAAVARYAASAAPGGAGVVQFDGVCGGAVNRVAAADTAFVHRDSAFLAQYLAYWPADADRTAADRQQAWLDRLWSDLRPWAGGSAYQNYADPKLPGWAAAHYGANLPRLRAVKARYDPDELFRSPQGVRP
ncbi:FAD-binding protein [Streptomyces bambusae]|uniref:FAD-binding oxidoreductase n=1 Tax=Streptomyces bambusae TaxID=1550616 RepID=UPI001CFDB671|nr:FAD-binding protein [Streptomyces bambusae]MCB5165418.1 FAD-binding protein [Streptomyces bambusae]